MSVKITQPSNMEHDAWRRLYIRLLTKELVPWDGFTQEQIDLEGGVIEDLIVAGYMGGTVHRDVSGKIIQVVSTGPTIAGRIFAEEQQDILDKNDLFLPRSEFPWTFLWSLNFDIKRIFFCHGWILGSFFVVWG